MDLVLTQEPLGAYPTTAPFESNETLDSVHLPAESNTFLKRHAACDECRKRKLKCSGEVSGCSRCIKNSLMCVYSEQKQMGRPKKRQKTDEDDSESRTASSLNATSHLPHAAIDPNLSPADIERTNFQNICPGPLAQTVRQSAASYSRRSNTVDTTPPSDHPTTPPDSELYTSSYPTDYSLWPDFSDTNVPLPVLDGYGTKEIDLGSSGSSGSSTYAVDPDVNPSYLQSLPAVPDCPCLPNLYLTLSTLSTLSAFPVSFHTLTTLQAAHRTARAVLYCAVCPQKFQSGSQNVMLSGTLLTVLVDQWHRVLKCPPIDLRRGFADPTDDTQLSQLQRLEWRTFAYDLIRHHVFGDRPYPITQRIPITHQRSCNPLLARRRNGAPPETMAQPGAALRRIPAAAQSPSLRGPCCRSDLGGNSQVRKGRRPR
jgi:Fungal Zn(2)-Cys(6) binuclear cluster domain